MCLDNVGSCTSLFGGARGWVSWLETPGGGGGNRVVLVGDDFATGSGFEFGSGAAGDAAAGACGFLVGGHAFGGFGFGGLAGREFRSPRGVGGEDQFLASLMWSRRFWDLRA